MINILLDENLSFIVQVLKNNDVVIKEFLVSTENGFLEIY